MKVIKKKISDLTLCYCVAPLIYKGEPHLLVASEKEHPCYLFDSHGNKVDTIWTEPGGTMSAVQLPGVDGAFLATHKFYSPNNSKEAKIVLCYHDEDKWIIKDIAQLPYVHRFDILRRDGETYLLACCIKSDYEYNDDWRFPGMTLACRLPKNLMSLVNGVELEFTTLKDNMLKNHGYSHKLHKGIETGIVTCEEGVFRFVPPANDGSDWTVEQLIAEPTSDALLLDFDGDGEEELLTLSPFHGDTLRVFHRNGSEYSQVYEYENKIEFAHAICAATIEKENMAIIGYRKGKRELFAVRYADGKYYVDILDSDVGPANVMHTFVDGRDVLLSANREINEVAYYEVSL